MKPTLTQAIKAKCIDCIYDPFSGHGSRLTQITDCPSPDCPLYPVRPVNCREKDRRKQEKIHNMSETELIAYKQKQDIARDRFNKVVKKA